MCVHVFGRDFIYIYIYVYIYVWTTGHLWPRWHAAPLAPPPSQVSHREQLFASAVSKSTTKRSTKENCLPYHSPPGYSPKPLALHHHRPSPRLIPPTNAHQTQTPQPNHQYRPTRKPSTRDPPTPQHQYTTVNLQPHPTQLQLLCLNSTSKSVMKKLLGF